MNSEVGRNTIAGTPIVTRHPARYFPHWPETTAAFIKSTEGEMRAAKRMADCIVYHFSPATYFHVPSFSATTVIFGFKAFVVRQRAVLQSTITALLLLRTPAIHRKTFCARQYKLHQILPLSQQGFANKREIYQYRLKAHQSEPHIPSIPFLPISGFIEVSHCCSTAGQLLLAVSASSILLSTPSSRRPTVVKMCVIAASHKPQTIRTPYVAPSTPR